MLYREMVAAYTELLFYHEAREGLSLNWLASLSFLKRSDLHDLRDTQQVERLFEAALSHTHIQRASRWEGQ